MVVMVTIPEITKTPVEILKSEVVLDLFLCEVFYVADSFLDRFFDFVSECFGNGCSDEEGTEA